MNLKFISQIDSLDIVLNLRGDEIDFRMNLCNKD